VNHIGSSRYSYSQPPRPLSRKIDEMIRVLIVDDDQELVSLLQRFLQND
jgi:hypothetical protein